MVEYIFVVKVLTTLKTMKKWTPIVSFLVHLSVQLPIFIKLYFAMTHLARVNLEIHFVFTFVNF
jgi:hypothetical protein